MKRVCFLVIFVLISITYISTHSVTAKQNDSKEAARARNSIDVLKALAGSEEEGIPEALLRNAQAIAIVPGYVKAAWVLGGQHGKGVIAVRNENGWSYPSFISLTGGSLGFQIGVQKADIVLVFKDKRSVYRIAQGNFKLGADVGLAAGPVGRRGEVSTDIKLDAEIYSYSRSKGLFAGISVEGVDMSMDKNANAAFYRNWDLTPEDILKSEGFEAPELAKTLVETLTRYAK